MKTIKIRLLGVSMILAVIITLVIYPYLNNSKTSSDFPHPESHDSKVIMRVESQEKASSSESENQEFTEEYQFFSISIEQRKPFMRFFVITMQDFYLLLNHEDIIHCNIALNRIFDYANTINDKTYNENSPTLLMMKAHPEYQVIRKNLSLQDLTYIYEILSKSRIKQSAYFDEMETIYKESKLFLSENQ